MLVSCAQQNKIAVTNTNETAIAFPGAEGFGKYATGVEEGKY